MHGPNILAGEKLDLLVHPPRPEPTGSTCARDLHHVARSHGGHPMPLPMETILRAHPVIPNSSMAALADPCVRIPTDFEVAEGREFQQCSEIVFRRLLAQP